VEHLHTGGAGLAADLVFVVPIALAVVLYLGAAIAQARRGNTWPWHRTALWLLGVTAAASGFVGPLAEEAHRSFTGHMLAHVLVGMLAPVLLVLSAPVTLALRTMDAVPARRLARLLASAPARIVTHPVVAAAINIGALWVLYQTPLLAAMQNNVLVHTLVMVHILVAGYLFTVSIIPIDPAPHRASYPLRTVVLVLALAAHGVLAKTLYARAPSGVNAADAEAGAMLMYYAGDVVDVAIIAVLFWQWYRHAGAALSRSLRAQSSG
jgi:putative membrane protein